MIVSGQITKNDALKELEESLYDERELEDDKLYFMKKLDLSVDAF